MKNELSDCQLTLSESERKRNISDNELHDLIESIDDLKASNEYLSNCRIKLEKDNKLLMVRNLKTKFGDKDPF